MTCHPGTMRLRGSGLLAPRHRMATVACSMPASVYLRVARKRKFSTLSIRSAVENGSICLGVRFALCIIKALRLARIEHCSGTAVTRFLPSAQAFIKGKRFTCSDCFILLASLIGRAPPTKTVHFFIEKL